MTVQLPILLWTVITFCLMVFVLNRFLFRPMLSFMDKRQEKIERAAVLQAEHTRALAETEEKLAAFRAEEEKHQAELVQQALRKARQDAEDLITITHRKQNQNLDLHVAQLEMESKEIENVLDKRLEELAELYAAALLSR
ncbi:MAG: hypothetical protein E7631_10480 [Ruminococcaceae bacterium]|nr:hypothetical protein [Oscillospiraceae bacterium]